MPQPHVQILPHDVTPADLAVYDERGYWVSPPLLPPEGIAELRRAHERIWAGDFDTDGSPQYAENVRDTYEPGKLRQLINGWWINDAVRDTVLSDGLGRMAAALLRCERVRLWHDQVIYKPPAIDPASGAGNVGWHKVAIGNPRGQSESGAGGWQGD